MVAAPSHPSPPRRRDARPSSARPAPSASGRRRYSPPMTPTRSALAAGLLVSGALLAILGGWSGVAFAVLQAGCAVALVRWPASPGPVGGALVAVFLPPVAAIRHWTARLPGACPCARLPHPPALVSWTGLVVLLDIVMLALAIFLATAHRRVDMRQSSS